jgi:hypothetical protein
MRSGVFQYGCEPSCILTVSGRLPTSAPGPPPRVRVVSGLAQPATAIQPISRTLNVIFTSHRFRGKDDDHAQKETAEQYEDGGCGQIQLAKTPRPPR